jgi:hypothetical protein
MLKPKKLVVEWGSFLGLSAGQGRKRPLYMEPINDGKQVPSKLVQRLPIDRIKTIWQSFSISASTYTNSTLPCAVQKRTKIEAGASQLG